MRHFHTVPFKQHTHISVSLCVYVLLFCFSESVVTVFMYIEPL